MEARLREFRAGKAANDDGSTAPSATGGTHQSMVVEIPKSPIYGDGRSGEPQPKGSLPKQSSSYSYNPARMGSDSSLNDAVDKAALPGKLASPQSGPNRAGASYKSMALGSYHAQKEQKIRQQNLARRRRDSGSSSDFSAQTDSDDEAVRQNVVQNPSTASKARQPAVVRPASVPGSYGTDSDSLMSSESESEEERGTMPAPHSAATSRASSSGRGRDTRVLMIGDKGVSSKSPARKHRDPRSKQRGKSLANASLYVAAQQPPWVEAALAEQAALENDDEEFDSSEDERDRTREGKGGKESDFRGVCGAPCDMLAAGFGRLVSKPDPVERELPPDREWERAEKSLSTSRQGIQKKPYNLWGRISPKRCTLPVQTRLVMWGISSTAKSSKVRQLAPQILGFFFIFINSWGIAVAQDNTGTRLFGERNYMLFVFTVVCAYCLQFCCEHHREFHSGQLLCEFEGRTWQVLNAAVRDRMDLIGRRYMKAMRWTYLLVMVFYLWYLFWASYYLKVCNPAELQAGCLDGDGLTTTTLADGTPKGGRGTYGSRRLVAMLYPALVLVTTAFICLLDTELLVDRINAYTSALGSAQFVFSRPEAQAEHDLVLASTQRYSQRWGPMLVFMAVTSLLQAAMLCSFFKETSWSPEGRDTRWPPPVACAVLVLTMTLWFSAARVSIAGDRLVALSVGVNGARIPLKGMLGRTSWCNYYMSLPIAVELPGNVQVSAQLVWQALFACGLPLLYLGFDPVTCEDGWFSCPGNEGLGIDSGLAIDHYG
jgi:hypothetical protein